MAKCSQLGCDREALKNSRWCAYHLKENMTGIRKDWQPKPRDDEYAEQDYKSDRNN